MCNPVQFTPEELNVIYMGLQNVQENMELALKDVVFNKDAKRLALDLIKTVESARTKLEEGTGIKWVNNLYEQGDETPFINPHN